MALRNQKIGNPQEGTLTGTGAWFNQEEYFSRIAQISTENSSLRQQRGFLSSLLGRLKRRLGLGKNKVASFAAQNYEEPVPVEIPAYEDPDAMMAKQNPAAKSNRGSEYFGNQFYENEGLGMAPVLYETPVSVQQEIYANDDFLPNSAANIDDSFSLGSDETERESSTDDVERIIEPQREKPQLVLNSGIKERFATFQENFDKSQSRGENQPEVKQRPVFKLKEDAASRIQPWLKDRIAKSRTDENLASKETNPINNIANSLAISLEMSRLRGQEARIKNTLRDGIHSNEQSLTFKERIALTKEQEGLNSNYEALSSELKGLRLAKKERGESEPVKSKEKPSSETKSPTARRVVARSTSSEVG